MKSYEDIAERVFRKGDAILERKHRKAVMIKKISCAVSGACAVILVGFGIWKNDSLKNAFDFDDGFITDNNIVTETYTDVTHEETYTATQTQTETDIPVQTTCTESVNYTTVLSGINETSTVTESQSVLYQTVITTDSTSPEIEVTEVQTIPLNETVQTTISTTIQTDSIVTDTTSPSNEIEDERSFYMKKLTSFLSAMALATAMVPTMGDASTNVDFKVNPARYSYGEEKIFDSMESGELDVDINGNGEFDIMDCYLLDSYCSEYYSYKDSMDSEIVQRIESIADYDGNGQVDFDDTRKLMRYFIVSGKIKYEYFNPTYYDPEASETLATWDDFIANKEVQAYCFPMRMFYQVGYLQARYYIIDELYKDGKINIDFNGNGQLDVGDIYDMKVYLYTRENYDEVWYPEESTARTFISDEEWQRCEDFFNLYYMVVDKQNLINSEELMVYFVNNIELKPEYLFTTYYKENFANYQTHYYIPGTIRTAAKQLGIEVEYVEPEYDIEDFEYILHKNFDEFYDSYCADVENGNKPVPDVNMDGVLDCRDFFDINIYWDDRLRGMSADESLLPATTWNNIDQNYDYFFIEATDGSETIHSVDINDVTAIRLYITQHVELPEEMEGISYYKTYLQKLREAKDKSITYDNNTRILLGLDEERSGDTNEDGEVSIADAVLIMQSLVNPDEYKITETGQYNGDVYNTGDGITAADASQIQVILVTKS